MELLLAQFSEDTMAMVAVVLLCGIPIIAILTHHQRKMAELIHRNHNSLNPAVVDEVNRLRSEVQQLRTELHQTAIALDDARRTSAQTVTERVREL